MQRENKEVLTPGQATGYSLNSPPYRCCPLIGSFVRTKALNESCEAPSVRFSLRSEEKVRTFSSPYRGGTPFAL